MYTHAHTHTMWTFTHYAHSHTHIKYLCIHNLVYSCTIYSFLFFLSTSFLPWPPNLSKTDVSYCQEQAVVKITHAGHCPLWLVHLLSRAFFLNAIISTGSICLSSVPVHSSSQAVKLDIPSTDLICQSGQSRLLATTNNGRIIIIILIVIWQKSLVCENC